MAQLAPKLRAALRALALSDADGAAVALVIHYADLMDKPGVPVKYDEPLRTIAGACAGNDDAVYALRKIVAALSLQSAASDFGPKLLAGLESLGMTPRARRSLVKGATHGGPASPLDELRRKRATRAAR